MFYFLKNLQAPRYQQSMVLCEMIFVWFQIMPAALVISCMRAKSAIVNTHINLPEIEANLPEIHIVGRSVKMSPKIVHSHALIMVLQVERFILFVIPR